jgi:fructose-specific phosphotransferase system IIC component
MFETTAARAASRPLLAAGAVVCLLAGTIMLWAHYGTAVFFETIRAGFMACFG